MKLLKFVNGDGPQTLENVQLTTHRLTVTANAAAAGSSGKSSSKKKKGEGEGGAEEPLRSWDVQPVDQIAVTGGYWLLDDDNKPIAFLNQVLLATPTAPTSSTTHHPNNNLPRGITDEEIQDVTFRITKSQKNVREKAAYGSAYIGKYESKVITMDAGEKLEKREGARKRAREAVMAAVEGGEDVAEAKKRSAKEEK